jgi:RNA polymerase I-specific transcription initiation factor RRN3
MFDLEGLIDLEIDPGHPQYAAQQQDALMQLQDGFHDPAAFAAASHHHGARRAQELAAAAAGGQPGSSSSKPARAPVDVTADKLDSMMELVFGHLQRRVAAGQLAGAWETMLSVFEGRLLHAHRCKFTQFLLFFLAVQEPARCCGSFTAALMRLLRSPAQPAITRCACAAYLASFLARCGPAPPALVVDVLHKLAAAAQEYADGALEAARRHQQSARGLHRVGSSSGGGGGGLPATSSNAALVLLAGLSDLMGQGPLNGVAAAGSTGAGGASSGSAGALAAIQRHQVFYAMVQALLYLLCYHMQPLFNAPPGSEQQALGQALAALVRQQVLPLLSHALAPLAVCHQAVTAEFVRQALLLGLADAEWEAAALEAVSQHQAALEIAASVATAVVVGGDSGSGSGGGGGDGSSGASGAAGQLRVLRPLEVFFPFDPYLLRRSARFLELPRTYVCFSHGHPHAAGAAAAAGRRRRRGRGAEQLSGSEDGEQEGDDDTTSDDEADWQEQAVMEGDGSGSGSDSESSSSSDEDDDGDEHHQQPGGAPAAAAAAAAASGGGVRLKRRAASLLPVGLAAAASGAPGGGGLSGPSPPPDMMATSLLGTSGGMSFGSGGGGGLFGGPGGVGGGVSPYGTSPMPMSITPYEGGTYMAALHSQLNGIRGGGVQ